MEGYPTLAKQRRCPDAIRAVARRNGTVGRIIPRLGLRSRNLAEEETTMSKEEKPRTTRYYKIGEMERALVSLKQYVSRGGPQSCGGLHLSLTQAAVLLEAARYGASKIYDKPELLDSLTNIAGYP